MGRRKIEIQPITHERNRSVTFLKRKNGLFKKAYELGVLCSVDVAVIIFEERPGHQRKLYQYCSTDVQSIVQQHLRHDGERDTRGPGDFSGASAAKMDDVGDGDEDDGEDDDEDLPSSTRKRARAEGVSIGKLRPSHDQDNMMHTDMDYNTRLSSHNHAAPSTFGIPPSIAHALSSHHTSHSSHPMSSDRLRPVPQFQNKKTKLDIHEHGRGHSHPEDPSPVSGGNDYTFPAPSSSSFRHPQHPSSPSPASSLHQVSYGNPQYAQSGFFSNTPTQSVPPSSYMHSQGDMTSSRGRSYTSPAGSTAYSPQTRPRPATASGSGGSTGDLLVTYLDDPSGTRRTSSAGTGASGPGGPSPGTFAIDWPGPPTNNATAGSSSTAASANSAQAGSHWLDFLSGNGNQQSSTQGHSQSHSATSTPVPPSISHANVNTQKHSSSQSMSGWPPQSRSHAGASPTGRNSGVRRSTSGGDGSGAGVSLDVEQLFGAGAPSLRGGEVKKEG